MSAHLVPGDSFGAYIIESELGRGAQGVVYRARQAGTERSVALKVFDEIEDAAKRARFAREAVAAARVEHPHIVPVYESGDVDGVPFLAMRLVPGPSLDEIIARVGPLAAGRAIAILGDVASAVDAAHAHGLVHRDIKPANVLVDIDDRAFLSDFGVARIDDLPRLTRKGDWLGTVEYMAPELAEGAPASAASDRYAFAVMAYEMLAGRPPFVHQQTSAVLVAQVRDAPPPIAQFNDMLPGTVDAVFADALAKDPARRPATAEAMVQRLTQVLESAGLAGPVRSGDTMVQPLPGGADPAGWTAVMRRISDAPAPPPPDLDPAERRTRVRAGETRVDHLPPRPPQPGPAAPATPVTRPPRRGRRVALAVLGALTLAGAAAAAVHYYDRSNAPDVAAERGEAYQNGFRNGRAKGFAAGRTKGVAEGRKAGEAAGVKKGREQGLQEGRTVPDASPGEFHVARVASDGTAQWQQPPLVPGSCYALTADGVIQPLDPLPPFFTCGD